MTDAEIIKALECHNICRISKCEECPLFLTNECSAELSGYALDLINHQKAELENQSENFKKLVAEHRKLQTDYSSMQSTLAKMSMGVEEAKAEAIKELMFNLDNEISTYSSAGKDLNVYAWLKNYAKEKIGE